MKMRLFFHQVAGSLVFAAIVFSSASALAFSQIIDDSEDAGELREGIVAVPLPPLSGKKTGVETPRPPSGRVESVPPSAAPPANEAQLPSAGNTGKPQMPTDAEAQADPAAAREKPAPGESAETEAEAAPAPGNEARDGEHRPAPTSDAPGPATPVSPVHYGETDLPRPVADLRTRLIEAARTGRIETLRPFIETGENGTVLSFGGEVADPIAFLKAQSGDGAGTETLAILLEVLEAGYVLEEPGSENAIYVWPYFAQTNLETLSASQKVELFELVTAGDYQSMLDFGAYDFYRIGITPEGELAYFVTGD